jgi:hypothetical protein
MVCIDNGNDYIRCWMNDDIQDCGENYNSDSDIVSDIKDCSKNYNSDSDSDIKEKLNYKHKNNNSLNNNDCNSKPNETNKKSNNSTNKQRKQSDRQINSNNNIYYKPNTYKHSKLPYYTNKNNNKGKMQELPKTSRIHDYKRNNRICLLDSLSKPTIK